MKTLIFLSLISFTTFAQTNTTVELDKKYEGMSLYFYKNTLKMLNQKDDKDFDELIKDIEKMRFVMVNKAKEKFGKAEYASLKRNYEGEKYELMMTSRLDGRNFDVLIREENGNVKGTVILANDSSSLYVLDILGKVALNKAGALFSQLDSSTDIGKKIKDFAAGNDKKKIIRKKLEGGEENEDEKEKQTKKN